MEAIMKAAILHEAKDIRIVDLEMPKCGPKDIIVKTVRSGICGSDLTAFKFGGQAMFMEPDSQFGHETAGYITEVGDATTGFIAGMRVFLNPSKSGTSAMSLGGFSEYIRMPDAKLNYNVFVLPDDITYDEAALIEPYAVAARGKNIVGAKPGDNIVVYGVGSIGLCCIDALCAKGIYPVAVVRSNTKRKLLEKMGAIVCDITETDLFGFLKNTFGTGFNRMGFPCVNVDIVVDCAGAPNIIDEFLEMRKTGSRLSIVSVYTEPVPVSLMNLMSSESIIQGSCAYENEDIGEAINNLASKKTPISKIITHHYKLEQISEAIEMAGNRNEAIKVLIDMDG